jgi:hypothetical protein
MAKIQKHADFMDTLHSMITKEATGVAASTGAATVTGKPGADTHYTSVSKETEHVDKNKEGHPEHNPQEFKQEKATDKSDPSKKHKSAEELEAETTKEAKEKAPIHLPDTKPAVAAKEEAPTTVVQHEAKKVASDNTGDTNTKLAQLGQQLLDTINEMNKQASGTAASTGAATVTGKPSADTHYTSVSKETEHVDKNKQGRPEHNPQEFKQEKATDKSDPSKKHKSAEELDLDKEASFELGRQFARAFLSNKVAAESNIYKEAGRRDFEALIAQASAELDQAKEVQHEAKTTGKPVVKKAAEVDEEALQIKQAEEAGAAAFHALVKQAQEEEKFNQVKLAYERQYGEAIAAKTAAEKRAEELAAKLAAQEAAAQKQAEEAKLDAKFASWGSAVVEQVIARLKNESAH